MKILILNFFGVLILFGFNTCTNDPLTVTDKTLVNTKWDLQSFEVIGVGESDIGSEGIFLVFQEDSTFKGRSSNNSYGGIYEVGSDDFLSIELTHTTEVALPAGSKYEEYIQAHRNASFYEIEGNMLRIFYDGKTKALNFKAE